MAERVRGPGPRETMTKIMIQRVEARRAAGENVLAPWRMTWDPTIGQPRNLLSGHPYRGANVWMTLMGGYSSPFWVTRKQIGQIGGKIKKRDGEFEPYTPILFWWFPTPEQEKAGRFAFCRFYQAWNVAQVAGIDGHPKLVLDAAEPKDPIAEAEALLGNYLGKPPIEHGKVKACYNPSGDNVWMPDRSVFESSEAYYRALFHEMTHSTGHRSRLARDGIVNPIKYASHDYSEEELVAEMGATILASFAGIGSEEADENSAAYLDFWLAKLKAEPNMLAAAGGAAQKATDLIRGIKWEKAE